MTIKISIVRNDFSRKYRGAKERRGDGVNRLRSAFSFGVWCEVEPERGSIKVEQKEQSGRMKARRLRQVMPHWNGDEIKTKANARLRKGRQIGVLFASCLCTYLQSILGNNFRRPACYTKRLINRKKI